MIKVAIGIDIGGTNTQFGIVDIDGNVISMDTLSTQSYLEIEVYIAALAEKIKLCIKKLKQDVQIIGVGVGAPLANINTGCIENAVNLPWKGIVPIAEIIKSHFDVPVVVTNDANAAAVGEHIFGGAKNMKNFVVITLGTGLGSGFFVDGKLVYGATGFAGELGHTTIRPGSSNRQCNCGKKGCLETYVSATGIKRTFLKLIADSIKDSKLRDVSFNKLNSLLISEAAEEGDTIAKQAFEHTGQMLGLKLADLVAHTDPEAIFLFGGLALSKGLIFEPAKKSLNEHLLFTYKDKVQLLPSELTSGNAAILGASALAWEEIKKIN